MYWLPEVFLFLVLPACLVYGVVRLLFRKKVKLRMRTELIRLGAIAYAICLLYLVWLDRTPVFDQLLFNAIPFKTISEYLFGIASGTLPVSVGLSNLLGNILLTFPLGIFLFFGLKKAKFLKIFFLAAVIPILLETGQLLLHMMRWSSRSVDIDDVLLNMSGIIAGYYVSKFLFQNLKEKENDHYSS